MVNGAPMIADLGSTRVKVVLTTAVSHEQLLVNMIIQSVCFKRLPHWALLFLSSTNHVVRHYSTIWSRLMDNFHLHTLCMFIARLDHPRGGTHLWKSPASPLRTLDVQCTYTLRRWIFLLFSLYHFPHAYIFILLSIWFYLLSKCIYFHYWIYPWPKPR